MKNTSRPLASILAASVAASAFPAPALAGFRAAPVAAVAPGAAVAPIGLAPAALTPATVQTPSIDAMGVNVPTLNLAAPLGDATEGARIGIPGPAWDTTADEAAAYAEDVAVPADAASGQSTNAPASAPTVAPRGLVGRLVDFVRGRNVPAAKYFDGSQRRPSEMPLGGRMSLTDDLPPVVLPNASHAEDKPTAPPAGAARTVFLQSYALNPGARDVSSPVGSDQRTLLADPNDMAAVVDSLRSLVDRENARFGVPSANLRLIHAKKFAMAGELGDTIFVNFRQTKDNMVVHGSNLTFTIKVVKGKAVVVSQIGQLFPQVDVDVPTLDAAGVNRVIAEQTGYSTQDVENKFQFFEEKIVYANGKWRHVRIFLVEGLPIMVAVDLADGLVFKWDNRHGAQSLSDPLTGDAEASAVGGSIAGKAVDHGPILPTATVAEIALGFMTLDIDGRKITTDKDGRFTLPAGLDLADKSILTASLAGPFAYVKDAEGKNLTVRVELQRSDREIRVVVNPTSGLNDENALAQISAFNKVNFAYNFLKTRGLTTDRMDKEALLINTNINQDCNAYYTPGRPSLNFFRSSARCVNSAYDTVADHEYGHYWDDMTGGIVNGGASEGWGDIVSMYSLGNPVVGEHFLKTARNGVDYIRHGENTYQYNEFDEVHAQGQAWMGFAWKLRKALIAKLGDADGRAMAEALVLPTMFAKAANIPDIIAQVLVNAMSKEGTIIHEQLIRDTARLHGIELPTTPGKKGIVGRVLDAVVTPLKSSLSAAQVSFPTASPASSSLAATSQVLSFRVGMLSRAAVRKEIEQYLNAQGIRFDLRESPGVFSSDFRLIAFADGDAAKSARAIRIIHGWLESR